MIASDSSNWRAMKKGMMKMSTVKEVVWGDEVFTKLVRAAFPGAGSKRTIRVSRTSSVVVDDCWSDGSRSTYQGVSIADGGSVRITTQGSPFRPRVPDYALVSGIAVVEHSISRGKDMGFTVLLHPEDFQRLVTDEATCTAHAECRENPELARACAASGHPVCDERTGRILAAFRSLKSGPYRQEALRSLSVGEDDIVRLVEAGWLRRNRNGATAITHEGRAACSGVST